MERDDDIVPVDNTGIMHPDGNISNVELLEPMLKGVTMSIEDKFDMLMKAKSAGIPLEQAKTMIEK